MGFIVIGLKDNLFIELWHACAGSIYIPKLWDKVFYFPQGHLEQVLSSFLYFIFWTFACLFFQRIFYVHIVKKCFNSPKVFISFLLKRYGLEIHKMFSLLIINNPTCVFIFFIIVEGFLIGNTFGQSFFLVLS